MSTSRITPISLRAVEPINGLHVLARRVDHPRAVVVFVHGALDRAASFTRVARRLDDVDVVAYDRRGYQGSRAVTPLGFGPQLDDLVAVIDSESHEVPTVVVGHSFGGAVVLGALAGPLRTSRSIANALVFECSLPWLMPETKSRRPASDEPGLEAESFFRRMVSNAAWERLSGTERNARLLDGPALVADLDALHHGALFEIADIAVPTVVAYGDGVYETYFTELARRINTANPLCVPVHIEGTAHGIHLSRPERLARAISGVIPT